MNDNKVQQPGTSKGLVNIIPVGSPENQELIEVLNQYYAGFQTAGLPFPPLLSAFYYMLFDNNALGRPFDPEKISSPVYDISFVKDAAKNAIESTANHIQQEMSNAGIDFDSLEYNKKVLDVIGNAFSSAPSIQGLNADLDRFFEIGDKIQALLGRQPFDPKLVKQIKQELISGIATNVAHLYEAQLGKIHPAGFYMLKVLPLVAQNDAKGLKDRAIEAVTEGTKFPTNMVQFGQYFSKKYPQNNGKDGQFFKDEKGFMKAVKDALSVLEVNPHFLMMEASERQKQIANFLTKLDACRPETTPSVAAEIKAFASEIGQRKGFLTRHMGGHTGIVNTVEKATFNQKGVVTQLETYLKGLKKNASFIGMDSRIDYLEAFIKQLKESPIKPYIFIELMHYDHPEFKNSPLGHLFRNEKIKKDLPNIVEMLDEMRKTGEEYITKNMKLNDSERISYFQYLKKEYIKNSPQYSWNVKTTVKDIFGQRKENVLESRLNKEQLASRIATYVQGEDFAKALKEIPEWQNFIKDLRDRFLPLLKLHNEKGAAAFTRGEPGYEYEVFVKIKEFMDGLSDYSKNNNILNFNNIMLIENLEGQLNIVKENGDMSNIMESGSDGQIFRLFEKLFPRSEDAILIQVPKEKRLGLEFKEKSDELWREARKAIAAHIGSVFPQQSKEAVNAAINHLLDPRNIVEPDEQWSPANKSSSSADKSSKAKSTTRKFNFEAVAKNMGGQTPHERLAQEINLVINHPDFSKALVFKKPELYRSFVNFVDRITPKDPNGEIARIKVTQNPAEFFSILMSERFNKEFLTEISTLSDKKAQEAGINKYSQFRSHCVNLVSDALNRPVVARDVSEAVKVLDIPQTKVQTAPTSTAAIATTALQSTSTPKSTATPSSNLPSSTPSPSPSTTTSPSSSASSSASATSDKRDDSPTRPRAFGRGRGNT